MRIFTAFLALITVVHSQYGHIAADDNSQVKVDLHSFDCTGRTDGNYADGCSTDYVSCVAGFAYPFVCPAGLLFDPTQDKCDYPDLCGKPRDATSTTTSTTTAPPTTRWVETPVTGYGPTQNLVDLVDCTTLSDGFYSKGCSPWYTVCSFGTSTAVNCPEGLLFDQRTSSCEFRELCGREVPEATTSSYSPPSTTVSYGTTLQQDSSSSHACIGKDDGDYSIGCVNEFVQCVAGISYTRYCPAGLVFNQLNGHCDYSCEEREPTSTTPVTTTFETTPYWTTPSTTQSWTSPSTTQSYWTSPSTTQSYWTTPSTTQSYWTSPVSTTAASPPSTTFSGVCTSGDTSTVGDCSSKFRRCRAGQWVTARCPSVTVFDESIGLCVYDLPRCNTGLGPKIPKKDDKPSYSYPTAAPTYYAPVPQYQPIYRSYAPRISNPFFALRRGSHHRRRHSGSNEHHGKRRHSKGPRIAKGKLRYAPRPIKMRGRAERIADPFDGHHSRYIYGSFRDTFPRSYRKKERRAKSDSSLDEDSASEEGREKHTTHKPKVTPAGTPEVPSVNIATTLAPEISSDSTPVDDTTEAVTEATVSSSSERTTTTTSTTTTTTTTTPSIVSANDDVVSSKFAAVPYADAEVTNESSESEAEKIKPVPDVDDQVAPFEDPSEEAAMEDESSGEEADLTNLGDNTAADPISEDESVSPYSDEYDSAEWVTPEEEDVYADPTWDSKVGSRRKRSYASSAPSSPYTNELCSASQAGSLVALGFCRQDFVYCRASGTQVLAACPVGELYDGAMNRCTSTDRCGEPVGSLPSAQEQAAISVAQPSEQTVLLPASDNVLPLGVSTTIAGPSSGSETGASYHHFDACDGRVDGPLSLGCSVNYLVCSGGRGVERVCPQGLVFDEGRALCDYRQLVAACGGSPAADVVHVLPEAAGYWPASSTAASPSARPYVPAVNRPASDSQSTVATPYQPRLTAPAQAENVVDAEICSGVSDGLLAKSSCSSSYVYCLDGQLAGTMDCPRGLIYEGTLQQCLREEEVSGCSTGSTPYRPSVSTVPVMAKKTDQITDNTSSEDASAVPAYPQAAENEPFYPAEVPENHSKNCASGAFAVEDCSPKYTICSNGVDHVLSCAAPLVFSRASRSCEFKEFVAECSPKQAVTATTSLQVTAASTAASQPFTQCVYNKENPAVAVGYCIRKYAMCGENGILLNTECSIGHLFDARSGKCVPAAFCGAEQRKPNPYSDVAADSRCSGKIDGALVPTGTCQNSYVKCSSGLAVTQSCAGKFVFSAQKGRCVARRLSSECGSDRIRYVAVSNDHAEFCRGRVDGLYKDPSNCAGILQCFGGDMFVHSGCTSGLVFNEVSGQCDYRQNVPGCEQKNADPKMESGCRGAVHGAYLPHESDCSVFFRCVWDRLERMHCPTGTVFNPTLSVCDWPASVPHCSTVPAKDEPTVPAIKPY